MYWTQPLKVVPATLLLVSFLRLIDSTCHITKEKISSKNSPKTVA